MTTEGGLEFSVMPVPARWQSGLFSRKSVAPIAHTLSPHAYQRPAVARAFEKDELSMAI